MSHAVVMAGGGAAAAFEVGVLSQLERKGVQIDSVYGTSAGALNAACFAYGSALRLENMWRRIKSWRDLWSINPAAFIGFGSGVLNSAPLRRKINAICHGQARIRCCVTKVDITNGDLVYSYAGDDGFNASVEASAALPGIITPVGGRFSDGGLRSVCPMKKAIEDGHDHISVILCDPDRADAAWSVPDGFLGFLGVALRANSIRGNEVLRDDISETVAGKEVSVTVYAPQAEILGLLDFVPEKIQEAISQGMTADGKHHTAY